MIRLSTKYCDDSMGAPNADRGMSEQVMSKPVLFNRVADYSLIGFKRM
jgi:hypothetical protein